MERRGKAAGTGELAAQGARQHLASLLLGSAILGVAVLAIPSVAFSQQAAPTPSASQQVRFAIPAQGLPSAIDAFSRVSGWQVGYSSQIARSITTRAVSGTMSSSQALQAMLAGTGIRIRITGPTSAALVDPTVSAVDSVNDGSLLLDTIDVQGRAESAWGPVDGYVATRSGTATKTDIPLLEVPQTVNVVTAQQINDQNAKTVQQALRYTEGIDSAPAGLDETDQQVVIRGWTQNQQATYINGLQLGAIDAYFLERVEVLKGPASVLYGNANPGGIVTTMQKLPTETPIREVFVQGGYPNRVDAGFDVGGPLNADGTLLYRVAGIGFSRDNQMTESPASQRWGIAPSVTIKPDESTKLTIWGAYQNDPFRVWYPWLGADITVKPGPLGRIARSTYLGNPDQMNETSEDALIGYNFEHEFDNGLRFRSNTGYHWNERNSVGATIFPWDTLSPEGTLPIYMQREHQFNQTFQTDNSLAFDVATGPLQHKVLSGIDFRWSRGDKKQAFGWDSYEFNVFNPNYNDYLPLPDFDTPTRSTSTQVGLYLQDQIKYDNWLLLIGLRHDWYDSEARQLSAESTPDKLDQAATTYRAGLSYIFENGLAPYVSYATSFEPITGTDFSGNLFKPTTGNQYEAGVKYEIPGVRSLLQAAVFQITQQNVLESDPTVPCCYSRQVGEVRSRGFEASIKTQITDNWSILANYSYVDPIITESDIEGQEGQPWIAARNRGSLWTEYAFKNGPFDGLGIGGGVRFTGEYDIPDLDLTMPSVTLVDLHLSYEFGKKNPKLEGLRFDFNVTNLFDEEYFLGTSAFYYGEGRVVEGKLTYKW
ncbi:MAG: TonB-dependent siderophore receptor [Pseudomonadota bacterium]